MSPLRATDDEHIGIVEALHASSIDTVEKLFAYDNVDTLYELVKPQWTKEVDGRTLTN